MSKQHRCSQLCICAACEDTRALARRATAAEAALDALRAQVQTWRDRAAHNRRRQYNQTAWQAVAMEQERCADDLAALLDPPSGGPQT